MSSLSLFLSVANIHIKFKTQKKINKKLSFFDKKSKGLFFVVENGYLRREKYTVVIMTIRRAERKDIGRIGELLIQVNNVHHRGRPDLFRYGVRKYTDEELVSILADPATPVLVATDEHDTVAGYAFCIFQQHRDSHILTDVKTLYIDDLCVDETLRGNHIGQELYRAVVDFARRQGCYNVTLNVWSCNASAMAFYEKCGLKPQKVGMEVIL